MWKVIAALVVLAALVGGYLMRPPPLEPPVFVGCRGPYVARLRPAARLRARWRIFSMVTRLSWLAG